MRSVPACIACACVIVAGCDIVQPELEVDMQPALVIEQPLGHADIFADVDFAGIVVARLDGSIRDTLLDVRSNGRQLRARFQLRPDEGEAGTQLAVVLGYTWVNHGTFPLFAGVMTIDDTVPGAPYEVHLPVHPVATLDVQVTDTVIAAEQSLELLGAARLIFLDGRTRQSPEIQWAASDTTVVRVDGHSATGRSPGATYLVGRFLGQVDSFAVEVDPKGTIVVTPASPVRHYVLGGETIVDTLTLEDGRVGQIGTLDLTTTSGSPWLSATLSGRSIALEIDGSLLPPGGAVGELVVGSSVAGVADATIAIEARDEGAPGFEARSWEPLCTFGGTRRGSIPGTVACAAVRARAWNDGSVKRVFVEVENLLGSLPDSLSNSDEFIIRGWGISHPAIPGGELVGVRTRGPVGVFYEPHFDPHIGSGYVQVFGEFSGMQGAVVGCSDFGWPAPRYSTCDPFGETGHLRAEWEVPSTDWSLADVNLELHVTFPGLYGRCSIDCEVVE